MAEDEVRVELTGSVAELKAAMDSAAKSVEGASDSINRSLSRLKDGSTSSFNTVGESAGLLERKMEHLGVAVGFAIGAAATSTGSGVERILHAMTGLGFAMGPVAGSITLAIASIGLAAVESAKQAKEEAAKIAEAFANLEEKLTGQSLTQQITNLEKYKKMLETGGKAQPRINEQGQTLPGGVLADTPEEAEARVKRIKEIDALLATLRRKQSEEDSKANDQWNADKLERARENAADERRLRTEEENRSISEWEQKENEWNDAKLQMAIENMQAQRAQRKKEEEDALRDFDALMEHKKQMIATLAAAFDSLASLTKKAFQDMIKSGEGFKSFWKFLWSEIVLSFAGAVWHMVSVWAAGEVAKVVATNFSVGERLAAEKYGAVATIGIAVWEGIKWIAIHAAKAAAAAWAAISGIPVIGPALAPVIAAATLAGVIALGAGISSAAGGFDIPAGVNPLTQLHAQEMVLPKEYADVIRGMSGGAAGPGGGATFIIYAMDSQDVARALARNPNAVARNAAAGFQAGVAMPGGAGRNR